MSASAKSRTLPWWISGPVIVGTFVVLVWMERKRPLRHETEPKLRRDARNLAVAGLGAVSLMIAERPVVRPLTRFVVNRRLGLLQRIRMPVWLEVAIATVLLDYTLYIWHVATHRIPWIWRFHAVHHVDLDLDASTAIRFHFGELTQSVAWRAAQVVVIGVSPLSLSVWTTQLLISILFHHSNVKLPIETERWLNRLVVTPRMHGIHHAAVPELTDSNWSSGLTVWDRLHGTLRLDVAQDEFEIGVREFRDPEEVALPRIIAMPFEKQRTAGLVGQVSYLRAD
jgi:sterol desaturase/sphingolipid hydroxylase (fatty acid hydroxylase superfamily)